MHLILTSLLIVIAVPAAGASLYLLALTALSAPLPVPFASARRLRFDLIVPAHDEEVVLARVIESLKRVEWPRNQFRVVVVADNCTDATADIGRAGGAYVLERDDPDRRGKGYALEFAFRTSREEKWADAVVVVDADAEVSANLVEAIAARMERGVHAVQVHYGISNIDVSWRTRLMSIAMAAFHVVRSRARERLRVSCGLRGNGWAVTHHLLERVPYRAYSLAEDIEYGIVLGLAGYRVAYADEAHADAEMVSDDENVARKQRQRWESGRFALIRTKIGPLLRRAFGDRISLDLLLDLLLLPLSYVALNVSALVLLGAIAALWAPVSWAWLWLGLGCAAVLMVHILRGWQLSGAGRQGLLDLARAPGFVVWKLMALLRGGQPKEWVRTKRENAP